MLLFKHFIFINLKFHQFTTFTNNCLLFLFNITYKFIKKRDSSLLSLFVHTWQRLTLPHGHPWSTISAIELNFPVRNGKECFLYAIITRYQSVLWKLHMNFCWSSVFIGQALDLLVSVSWTCYHAYTSDLSTLCSSRGLTSLCYGKSHLEVGFTLRCFQRLSLPDLATQLCSWQNNWYTRGQSIPVLSY